MPGPKILTEKGIRSVISTARKTGRERWVSDGLIPRTHGGLQLRVKPAACFWYFRYTDAQGKKQRIPLGILAFEKTPAALTLAEARAEAARLAALYQSPESRDVRDHLKQQLEREATERAAAEQAQLEALPVYQGRPR